MPEVNSLNAQAGLTAGVTGEDIRACFELMLGRSPDDALVEYHLSLGFASRATLGQYIRGTAEFEARFFGVSCDPADFGDEWRARAISASVRSAKLKSFGSRARGLWLEGNTGWYVVDPEDGAVSLSLLRDGQYASSELADALAAVPPQGRVLIVGTHIGSLAIPLSKHCSRLDAVEPNPRTRLILEANLRLNDCENITVIPFAASSRTETLEFLLNRDNSGGSKRKPISGDHYYYDDPEVVRVEARAMDDVLDGSPYDLIIMDCEGSEYHALQGMPGTLSRSKALAMEFLGHHIVNVGGADIDSFSERVEPFFNWMFVPTQNRLVEKQRIRECLREMFERGEAHDALYFLKEPRFLPATGDQ